MFSRSLWEMVKGRWREFRREPSAFFFVILGAAGCCYLGEWLGARFLQFDVPGEAIGSILGPVTAKPVHSA